MRSQHIVCMEDASLYHKKSCSWKKIRPWSKSLIKAIQHSGRNIACDNFFASIPLVRDLQKKKLPLVGAIRKNKPELASAIHSCKSRDL